MLVLFYVQIAFNVKSDLLPVMSAPPSGAADSKYSTAATPDSAPALSASAATVPSSVTLPGVTPSATLAPARVLADGRITADASVSGLLNPGVRASGLKSKRPKPGAARDPFASLLPSDVALSRTGPGTTAATIPAPLPTLDDLKSQLLAVSSPPPPPSSASKLPSPPAAPSVPGPPTASLLTSSTPPAYSGFLSPQGQLFAQLLASRSPSSAESASGAPSVGPLDRKEWFSAVAAGQDPDAALAQLRHMRAASARAPGAVGTKRSAAAVADMDDTGDGGSESEDSDGDGDGLSHEPDTPGALGPPPEVVALLEVAAGHSVVLARIESALKAIAAALAAQMH